MKSLYEAARIMSENTLHRLPLVERDSDNNEMIISVLSQYKILKFIGANVSCIYIYIYMYFYILFLIYLSILNRLVSMNLVQNLEKENTLGYIIPIIFIQMSKLFKPLLIKV